MLTLQKETQKRSVIFTRENMDRAYFDTQMLQRVAHTFTKNVAYLLMGIVSNIQQLYPITH
jgi:hypothetical protein